MTIDHPIPSTPESDAMLVQRTLAVEQRAFDLLVIRYQRRVERLIGRMIVRDVTFLKDCPQQLHRRGMAIKDMASALERAQGTVRSAIEAAKSDGLKALAPKPTGRAVGQKRRLTTPIRSCISSSA